MKTCKNCDTLKPLTEFQNAKECKDGKAGTCKKCKAAYDKEYRETKKASITKYQIVYYKTNKDTLSVKAKERYIKNIDGVKAAVAAYRDSNKEKYKQYFKERHEKLKNTEQYMELRKKYASSIGGKLVKRISSSKRRACKLSTADGTITAQALEALKTTQDNKCKYCNCCLDFSTNGKVHLDHVIPLSKGGIHSISNVVWSCAKCNLMKSDKLL